jgi:hypothetical protein
MLLGSIGSRPSSRSSGAMSDGTYYRGPPGSVEGGGAVVLATNVTAALGPPGSVDGGGAVVLLISTLPEPEVRAFRPIAPVNTNRTKTTKINHLFIDPSG